MSQVSFKTVLDDSNIEVVGGYDRPLDYYHMSIFNLDVGEFEEDVVYCNLREEIFPVYPDFYKRVLGEMGVNVPDGFWERCCRKEGNSFYKFRDGKWNK
jgi:hypothetical protein